MATLPIYLEVEDVAVGPVLIALRKMPGIIKMNLDIATGAPTPSAPRQPGGPNNQELIVAALLKHNGGPLHIKDFTQQAGLTKSAIYGALNNLKNRGVVESADKKAEWRMTAKALREIGGEEAVKLLPPSKSNGHAQVEKVGKSGRAAQGAGQAALISILDNGALSSSGLRQQLTERGLSEKSASGIIERGRASGIIRKSKTTGLYELTAKGQKQYSAQIPSSIVEKTEEA